ncbi:MAG TPA: hypothetical protein DDW52_07740 [Planctomycetaceae bacterium]|nr:hypothetical protein [Planctomycetaceae bacterium]
MKSHDPEEWLRQRIELSGEEQGLSVDVADRVLATLTTYDSVGLAVDKTPLVLGGGLLAIAASIMLVLFPSFSTMTEPWISYWLI